MIVNLFLFTSKYLYLERTGRFFNVTFILEKIGKECEQEGLLRDYKKCRGLKGVFLTRGVRTKKQTRSAVKFRWLSPNRAPKSHCKEKKCHFERL